MSEKKNKGKKKAQRPLTGDELRIFACPQCNKPRMKRSLDFDIADARTKVELTVPGNTDPVLLFKDVCEPCLMKNFKKHFVNTPLSPKVILDSLDGKGELDKNKSLEEML